MKFCPTHDRVLLLLKASPPKWRTMVDWNVVLTIFHNYHIFQGLWKIVWTTYQCIVVLQLWGDWPKNAWNQDLRVQHMRPCLNELQKEYCMKVKLIALDWQWVTLITWCQMNRRGHSSPVMHTVEGKTHTILEKLKITSEKPTLFWHFFV